MVRDWVPLVSPTAVAGKLRAAGLAWRAMTGVPVPVMETVTEEGTAFELAMTRVALSGPTIEGEKVTWMLQRAPGLRAPVQGVRSVGGLVTKSAACEPVTAKVGRFMVTWPVLTTWTVKRALEFSSWTRPKLRAAGLMPRVGGMRPMPPRGIATEATPGLLVVRVRVAEVAPVTTGVKVT